MILTATQNASAIPINFTFSVTKPLLHGTDTLGGIELPLRFKFQVDSDSPDLNEPSTEDGLFELESASVQIGDERSDFLGGIIGVRQEVQGDGFTALSSGGDNGSRIAGRSLFVFSLQLFDYSGSMFSSTDLPMPVRNANACALLGRHVHSTRRLFSSTVNINSGNCRPRLISISPL